MNTQVIKGLTEILKTAKPAIQCAYVFGSLAKGTAKPSSDIDIAVLSEKLAVKDQMRLIQAVANFTERNVDWVDLNDAGTTVTLEALNGVRLLGDDEMHAKLLTKTLIDSGDFGLLYERILSERRETWFNE
jgi:uncharacterized protein